MPIIPIRTGARKPPIFLFSGIHGTVFPSNPSLVITQGVGTNQRLITQGYFSGPASLLLTHDGGNLLLHGGGGMLLHF